MGYTAIVDYGVGNLKSVANALAYIGQESRVYGDAKGLELADSIILPGVGAFPDAAERLRRSGLDAVLKRQAKKKPVLGICLGMQLLFERSYEYGCHEGLGLLKGSVRPIRDMIPADYKIPHIGWNGLIMKQQSPLMKYVKPGDCVYFVHSYYAADCDQAVIATAEYGAELTAAVAEDNVLGCQFHPEKSGEVGLKILKAFVEMGEKK